MSYSEPAADVWAPETTAYAPAADPQPAPVRQQAFWALAPDERDVVDEQGAPLFTVGPDAWALVIEDRGEAFVVRHEDGRVGYLHDVDGRHPRLIARAKRAPGRDIVNGCSARSIFAAARSLPPNSSPPSPGRRLRAQRL